jgi:hypothetical protein
MIKREELTNPKSCMSRAKDDEMTFVLLARDEAAPYAIREWAKMRVHLGKNTWEDQQIDEALKCAVIMQHSREAKAEAVPPSEEAPTAELISIKILGTGRREEFASLLGYKPPEGVEVVSREPLYLHEARASAPKQQWETFPEESRNAR